MNQSNKPNRSHKPDRRRKAAQGFWHKVQEKAARRLKSRQQNNGVLPLGLGLFGLVGWAVTIPTLAGIALGLWIDRKWPSQYSWTLMLLFLGVIVGCLNAWYWIQLERPED